MQRPDAYIMKQVQKELNLAKQELRIRPQFQQTYDDYFSRIDLEAWATLPLISLTMADLEMLKITYKGRYNPVVEEFIHWDEWFYEQFVLYYPAMDDDGFFWTTVWVDKEEDIVCFYGVMPSEKAGYDGQTTIRYIPFTGLIKFDEANELAVSLDNDYVKKMWGDNAHRVDEEDIKNHVRSLISNYITTINLLHRYIKEGDKHPVEVSPKVPANPNSPANKGKPWRIKGPSLLLLDRMPSQQAQGTGTHASPKPHRRRGHWRTLSHPRYKNHPQYGSKIYVKPSFIGPRQEVYQGNVYRLIQDEIYEMDLPQSA